MRRMPGALIALLLAATYFGRPAKGDDKALKGKYLANFYCFNFESVLKQQQSGDHNIVVGYFLPSINPESDEALACTKKGGIAMAGYVEMTSALPSLPK